ncbi:hypothetical protein SAY86_008891 [Trapa natans]|uniref:BHLH domain-containing protein n=1 Tax=Trapa natans TaxID=22666 RepID=A0AAN7K763_TRANT|nr:hypothetical protein SAY86_008891 [Trapa natans]
MMRGLKQEDHYQQHLGECSKTCLHNLQHYPYDRLLFHHQQHGRPDIFRGAGVGAGELLFPELIPAVAPRHLPPVHAFNPSHHFSSGAGQGPREPHLIDPFLLPPPPPPPYGNFFNRKTSGSLQLTYDGPTSECLRLIQDSFGVGPGSAAPFGLQADLGKLTTQEIMDAKALAASKSHSEAERRRRERINNHLAKLRSLLPSTTKTDKASLLAEVIQHVKELKRQTSRIAETSHIPTEIDELVVDVLDENGKFVVKASICCEDRPDLLPDLVKTLKAMQLRTLKAEITTLGGRMKNVLFIAGEENTISNSSGDHILQSPQQPSVDSIQEALKAVMEKAGGNGDESSTGAKRQRTTNVNIREHRSL